MTRKTCKPARRAPRTGGWNKRGGTWRQRVRAVHRPSRGVAATHPPTPVGPGIHQDKRPRRCPHRRGSTRDSGRPIRGHAPRFPSWGRPVQKLPTGSRTIRATAGTQIKKKQKKNRQQQEEHFGKRHGTSLRCRAPRLMWHRDAPLFLFVAAALFSRPARLFVWLHAEERREDHDPPPTRDAPCRPGAAAKLHGWLTARLEDHPWLHADG